MELGYVDKINLVLLYTTKNPYHDSLLFFFVFSYDNVSFLSIYRDNQYGYTPLMIAAMEGDQIVLDVLIACVSEQHLLNYVLFACVASFDFVPVLSTSLFHALFRSMS